MISVFLVALLLVSTSVEEDGDISIENETPENLSHKKQAIKVLEHKEDFDTFVTNDINQVVIIGFSRIPSQKKLRNSESQQSQMMKNWNYFK